MRKVSAIIPVYNSEKYLSKCLDSVLGQNFNDFEIIIVNDGSTDSSQDIIDAYRAKHPDRLISIQQKNAGQAAARNKGIELATGEFILFLDSDDYLSLNAFETAYSYAKTKQLDIVCFNMFADNNEKTEEFNYRIFKCADPIKRYILNETSPCNKLIRREFLIKNSLRFSEGIIYEDFELIPRLALYTNKIEFLDDYLYYYVIHDNSTMRQEKFHPKMTNIYLAINSLKNAFFHTEFIQELECIYIEHLLHGAGPRFTIYPEGKAEVEKIHRTIHSTFPKWYKNKYYKAMGVRYKIVCTLCYLKQKRLLAFLLKHKN